MIIKSFVRKNFTKAYFVIFIIIFLSIFIINSVIKNLNDTKTQKFIESTFIFADCKEDCRNILTNDKSLINIKKVILIDDLFCDNDVLNEEDLKIYDIGNKILGFSDDRFNLKNNEIILGLNELDYKNIELNKNKIVGTNTTIEIDFIQHNFIIKDIVNNKGRSEVIFSQSTFKNLMENNKNIYILNLKDEKTKDEKLIELKNKINGNIIFVNDYQNKDLMISQKIQEYLTILKLINYLIIFVLLVVTILTNRNMIYDLEFNTNLEYRLGFKKIKIKQNIFKRLFLLHFSSLIIAKILSSVISIYLNLNLNINIFLLLLLLILINDLIIISIYKLE